MSVISYFGQYYCVQILRMTYQVQIQHAKKGRLDMGERVLEHNAALCC